MKSVASIAAAAMLSGSANAFWRMPCHDRTALARLDPIVNVGTASTHSHTIFGGSNFGEKTTYDMLRKSKCTSCQFKDDKSAYWTPSLHFMHDDGKTELVPQVGGMLVYYLLIGENLKAFPEGFQMLSGDSRLRNYTGSYPDRPTAEWTEEDKTQLSLGQKAIGMNCLNYNKAPEGSRYRHSMPTRELLDETCVDGIRAEIMFPSCWNGKDKDTDNHKSHMAFPSMIDGGSCPKGFDTRLPTLFYETIWDTYKFRGKSGQFIFSNGDATAYGYHADFMNGWDIDTLQSAIDTCTNPSGRVEDCPIFSGGLQTEHEQAQCKIEDMPKFVYSDNCAGPSDGLCGNVPIQYGPAYAELLVVEGEGGVEKEHEKPAKPTASSVVSVTAQPNTPAPSKSVGGISVYNVEKPTTMVKSTSTSSSSSSSSSTILPPAPAATPPADIAHAHDDDNDDDNRKCTTYTKDGVVYEVVIVEVEVTTTVAPIPVPTPAPNDTPGYGGHPYKHRRAHLGHN